MTTPKPYRKPSIIGSAPLLPAEDLSATIAYFRDVLDFEIADEWPGIWVQFRRESIVVEIEKCEAIHRTDPSAKGGIVFQVEGLDVLYAELQRRGAKFNERPLNEQDVGYFSILDPSGNRLRFRPPLIDVDDGRFVELPLDKAVAMLATDPGAVHRRNGIGRTLLHMSAESGKTLITRLLIRLGADVNVVDSAGRVPLHMAANYTCIEDMKELLSAGARADIADCGQMTPMRWAQISSSGKIEGDKAISLLRQYGASE